MSVLPRRLTEREGRYGCSKSLPFGFRRAASSHLCYQRARHLCLTSACEQLLEGLFDSRGISASAELNGDLAMSWSATTDGRPGGRIGDE